MQTPARPGRPRTADAEEIARVALRLFERRGFDNVTMQEIAEASAVSVRTLFRLFPTKSDLVWGGLTRVRDVIKARSVSLAGAGMPPQEVLLAFVEPFLRPLDTPAASRLARRRLRLIASAPTLLAQPTVREIEALIAAAVSADASSPGTPPALLARTLVAITIAGLLWWAEHDTEMTAFDAVRAAHQGVARPGLVGNPVPARQLRSPSRNDLGGKSTAPGSSDVRQGVNAAPASSSRGPRSRS